MSNIPAEPSRKKSSPPEINNAFYDDLGEKWYTDREGPVALLRAESRTKIAWIKALLSEKGLSPSARILDVGCGAGFISNALAEEGYDVTGIDLSGPSLETARRHQPKSKKIAYFQQDALHMDFMPESFDIVLMMDFLEHVDRPAEAVTEGSRLLKPGGIIFYHTFNRNLLSRLVVIKTVEWLTKDCPDHMHVYELFITPQELRNFCDQADVRVIKETGLMPVFWQWPFWKTIFQRRLDDGFSFTTCSSMLLGYMGMGIKAKRIHQ